MNSEPDPYRFSNQAREKLSCDKHEEVLFVKGGNYGRCCRKCGEKLEDGWIPHDDLSEAEKDNAIENRDEIRKDFRRRVRERRDEIQKREEVPSVDEICPESGSPPEKWRLAFETVKDINFPEERADLFWFLYDEYLGSQVWSRTRERVFEEKGRECRAQLSVCEEDATEVHHTSYDHIGTEPLWHLMPVCPACHEVLHYELAEKDPEEESAQGKGENVDRPGRDQDASIDYDDLFDTPPLE